jgi:selenocysteine-specific elongation factor
VSTRSIVVGTAGHIDHGKSTLVRALTGTDPDRLKEEQIRGITIDLGFAHLHAGDVNLAFVDVPGHERFVKNMLAGAGGIDLVMLVVAADESVMPQTREHFQICRLLEVPAGLIVLTKSDVADADMIETARLEVRELVAGSFLADAPIVAVSSTKGTGLDDLKAALLDVADTVRARDPEGTTRLPIDRVFSMKGFGTVVTGTLVAGTIQPDTELLVLPRGLTVKVRGVQVHGRATEEAVAGSRVAVNLGGVDVADLARGDTLCAADAFEVTRRVDAVVTVLADASRGLRHGARVRFHQGTTELLGRVAIASDREAASQTVEILPGRSAYVRIRLEAPVVLTRGDRFILRSYSPSVSIGGGVVLDPHPPRSGIRNAAARERFQRLDAAGSAEQALDSALAALIDERAAAGLARAALGSRAGLSPSAAALAAERLVLRGKAIAVADLLVAPAVLADLSERVLEMLQAHHKAQPLSDGLPREEVRERIFGRSGPAVFDHVLSELTTRKKITGRDRLALAGHRVSLSAEEQQAHAAIERVFREAGLTPPDPASVAASANVPAPIAERMAGLLLREKTLVKVDALLFHADALSRLKEEVRALEKNARVDVAAFKQRYGITRKFAIPLLEYLDRERVTRRVGDSRVVL